MLTNKDVAEEWLNYAENDLEVAKTIFEKGESFNSIVMFHAPQAAEKAIKTILIAEEILYPKTHDLNKLLTLMEDKKNFPSKLYTLIAAFEEFGVDVRYPDREILITEKDILNVISSSSEIIKIAHEQINLKWQK